MNEREYSLQLFAENRIECDLSSEDNLVFNAGRILVVDNSSSLTLSMLVYAGVIHLLKLNFVSQKITNHSFLFAKYSFF
jgi:hypothetical protein